MTFSRTLAALLLSLAFSLAAHSSYGASARPAYKGAIVMEAATGKVLFEDHADEVSPPASMTKLMTFAVVEDQIQSGALSLGTRIKIMPADAKVADQGDSSKVALRSGETFTVEDLLYAAMIKSANDAAYALARSSAGSVPVFVQWMNAKARSLGMTHTTFKSPNGFPPPSRKIADGDLTSPRDFALLSRYLVLHTDATKYTSVISRPFGVGVRFPPLMMVNHNKLLGKVTGLDGLKTGFTNGAGFCLAATAQRGGRRLIVVVMDSPDAKTRDLKVLDLMTRGFETQPLVLPQVSTRPSAPGPAPAVAPGSPPPIQFSVPRPSS